MPFARVGVMPQPNANGQSSMNQKAANPSSGRQKGITMEDLKRQTALRLAHEQQHRGNPNGEEAVMTHQQQTNRHSSENVLQNQGYPHSRYPQVESPREQYHFSDREVPPQQYQQQPFQHNLYHQINPETNQRVSYENHPNSYRSGAAKHYNESQNALHYRNQNVQTQELMKNPHGEQSLHRYVPEPFPNKLAHGLTVQELKQMTKARLQAEASDTKDVDRLSPLDFDASVHEVRERAVSRDSVRAFQVGASESTNSIPSLVQVGQSNPSQPMRQPRASPVSLGFQSFSSKSPKAISLDSTASFVLPAQQTWEGGPQLKLDALETASINSYNNSVISDNLGSESAYSAGVGSGMLSQTENDFASIPFNPSLSYTGGTLISPDGKMFDGKPAISSASASPASNRNAFAFDAAVGGNRRRAATLSPNPSSILEDRPHFDGQGLAMPNFSATGRIALLARPRGHDSASTLSSTQTDNPFFGQATGMFVFDDGANRPRTQSSVSLPLISHTEDEFGGDRVFSHHFVSQGREGPANGYSGGNFADSGMTDRRVLAPPGFSGNSGYQPVGSSSIDRRSINSYGVDALANEMTAILSMSGEGTNRERLNTYPQSSKSNTTEYISEDFFSPNNRSNRF